MLWEGKRAMKPTKPFVSASIVFAIAIAVVLATAGLLHGQTVQGVVTGTVVDSSGATIADAELTLKNDGTGVSQTDKTHVDGVYRFPLVPPGTYTLTVTAKGFTTREIHNILVDASTTVPVQVQMSVASAQVVIEVSTQESLVQTESADLSTTVGEKMIQSMPLLTRNVFDLAFAAPAVTQGMNLGVSSGGARESGTTYMLNGAENNDNFGEGGANVTPPLESVAEFTMLTNNMSAQYGHAAGALVSAIQKSGTNSWHGVAYEFNRNAAYNANDFFSNRQGSPIGKYIRNQFGGEIDGPVIKNKTFFSFTYDRTDLHQGSNGNVSVPTPSELNAMKLNAGPNAQKTLAYWNPLTSTVPCPAQAANYPDSVGSVGCFFYNDPQLTTQNTYAAKLDHNFSTKDRLTLTANFTYYQYNDKYGGNAASTTPVPNLDNEHYHNLSGVETHVFSPTLVNELTLAHNRHSSINEDGNGKQGVPSTYIDGNAFDGLGFTYGVADGSLLNSFVQDRWQLQDNLGWTKGKHSIKIGGGLQYGILYRNWDLGTPGYYEFANATGGTVATAGAAGPGGTITNIQDVNQSNFQNDFPYYQELSIDPRSGAPANAYRHYMMKDMNVFVNDDWKISRRLTLNLGLRWERYGAPTEAHNQIAQFTNLAGYDPAQVAAARVTPVTSMWKTPSGDYGPRVGFAYDVFGDGKMSVRGGYGISYDRIFDNVWSNGAWNPPFYGLADHDATAGDLIAYTIPPTIAGYTPGSLPGPAGRVSVRTMDVNMKDSSIQNYYVGIERQFIRDFLLRVNFQGNFGRHLSQLMNLNRYDGMAYNPTLNTSKPGRPNSLYSGFNYRANNLNSHYTAMVTEVQKRMSHGLQFQFSFTWSKLMDEGSDLFSGSTTQGGYSQPFYLVSNNYPGQQYGRGAFDHTKNFKTVLTYELPFLKNQNGFAGRVLGGWQLSAFYQGYSGHPIEVYSARARYRGNAQDPNGNLENIGGDYNLDGVLNDHVNFVGSSASAAYSNFSPADGIFIDNNPIGCGYSGMKSTNVAACNAANGVATPNSLFVNPSGYGVHFGTLGRNVFVGPWFNGLDGALLKNFKVTEAIKMQLRFEALNLANHPNFDGITSNVNSGGFGKANILVGNAPSRRLQLGARITF